VPHAAEFTALSSLSCSTGARKEQGICYAARGACPASPIYFNNNSQHYNPSWLVLYGTSSSLNVFNLTADQQQNPNLNLDIEVPTGSTVIVNVSGSSVTLQNAVYFQGNTVTDDNAGTTLFNFPTAAWVTINGQFDGVVLQSPNEARELPQAIRCDNGPDLTRRHFLAWGLEWKIELRHIQPGKPTQNAHVESFHGRLREECLRANWFSNLFDACSKITAWRKEYNEVRPHSSLDYRTPTSSHKP
jgi:hypothetical protein